ncbi:DUF2490 domain-containing protein [Algibacter mikhailovii]|uniref:DUF2490 domain-containing protein n=1 Tax=Algibacter mikhailovii TaxID=425498 RepID=UPI002494BDEF|nr:DUF2490 domain-containing protein [Algibacter mikhailovii]
MKRLQILVLVLLPIFCFSQNSDLGNWLLYFGNKQINSKLNWHNEVQYRSYNAISDLEQLLIRTGIGYNLTENNNNILLGYGYILSENYTGNTDEKQSVNEHRIYQQFITKQNIGIVSLQHRYRFEQRFIESDFKLRLRYFLGLNIPLNKKQLTDKTLYASMYNEIFLNTQKEVFDRNRLYGALGYKLSSTIRFELGYMNQFLSNGCRDQINMVTFLNF